MLFVLFQLGNDRYALEARRVVEVVPLLALKKFPQSPPGVAGVFIYRGQPVPAVDLCELLFHRPAQERLSTRIIVVNYGNAGGRNHDLSPSPPNPPSHLHPPGEGSNLEGEGHRLLGLIAERATATMRRDAKEFKDVGVSLTATPYLGPVLTDDKGVVQLVNAQKLLTTEVRERLFAPAGDFI